MGVMQQKGAAPETVLKELMSYAQKDVDWRAGKIFTGLYDPGEEAHHLAVEAYNRFLAQNALYVNMYPSIGKLEQEVVASMAGLLRGDEEVVGNMTSGGTESIMMAVKTARDWARENRPHITTPELVLPVTAHPAFLKAAHYLGLQVVQTAVDLSGYRADLSSFKEALSPSTILAVGSAPNFSHGTIDPIADMASLADEKGVLFHVDACVGGIYLSILRRMGEEVRDFDFSIPGVTSISVDLHKYGYAPKNASVVLYRNRDLRKYAWFICTTTTEYAVINPTVQSSRTGGPVAAAWSVIRHLGEEGFQNIVRKTREATHQMLEAIEKMEDIVVLGNPDMCMFTIASDDINVFEIDDEMRARGWHLIPQFACGGSPANLHVSISYSNVPHTRQFLEDLQEAVRSLKENGPGVDRDEIARVMDEVKDKPIEEIMMAMLPLVGLDGTELPEQMAPLNTALDFIPAGTRDDILTMFFNMTT